MKKLIFTLATTLIFSAIVFAPIAQAGQYCSDGTWSASNKVSACAKRGGVISTEPKPKTATPTTPENASTTQLITPADSSEKSSGKIPGLCSRINRYAPGSC